jgi:nucleotide-binding universal stress UspA family protein
VKAAQTINSDLIVMGSHHPELKDGLLGPNAANMVRRTDCLVMVVRE